MLRFTTLCLLLVEGFLIVKAQDLINSSRNKSATTCSRIEADIDDANSCFECYKCDGEDYKNRIRKTEKTYNIKLYDSDCQPMEFCCLSQLDYNARSYDDCGKSLPAGYPRSARDHLKSVLQGEYPWRTWIFSAGSTKPLCAGVYIGSQKKAVITSATCVDEYRAQTLRVGFTRNEGNIRVEEIHKYDTDSRTNDIVILALSKNDALSPWAHPACLPANRPLFGTCIAVSDKDFYLNQFVPNQKSCYVDKQLDETKLCTVVAKDDYIPEVGGGMFCEQETTPFKASYFVNGIHLYQTQNIYVYTNIQHYVSWIYQIIS